LRSNGREGGEGDEEDGVESPEGNGGDELRA